MKPRTTIGSAMALLPLLLLLSSCGGIATLPPLYQSFPDPDRLSGFADLDRRAPFYGTVKLMDGRVLEGTVMEVDESELRFRSALREKPRYSVFSTEDIMRVKVYRSSWQVMFSMESQLLTVYDRSQHGEVPTCIGGIDWSNWPAEEE